MSSKFKNFIGHLTGKSLYDARNLKRLKGMELRNTEKYINKYKSQLDVLKRELKDVDAVVEARMSPEIDLGKGGVSKKYNYRAPDSDEKYTYSNIKNRLKFNIKRIQNNLDNEEKALSRATEAYDKADKAYRSAKRINKTKNIGLSGLGMVGAYEFGKKRRPPMKKTASMKKKILKAFKDEGGALGEKALKKHIPEGGYKPTLKELMKKKIITKHPDGDLIKEAKIATKTDPAKWEQAKRDAKARMGGKHSARAMQLATQIYKKRGGGYSGAKPSAKSNSLKKWGKQKWKWSKEKKAEKQTPLSFLTKVRKEGFLDPRSDDFAKNQALGRAMGAGLLGSIPGTVIGARKGASGGPKKSALLAVLGGLATGSIPAGITYNRKLKKFRELQKKGRNPALNKPFNVKRIERLKRKAKERMSKQASEGKGVYLPEAKIKRLKSSEEGKAKLRAAERKKAIATSKGEQYSSHGLAAGTSLKKTAMDKRVLKKIISQLRKSTVMHKAQADKLQKMVKTAEKKRDPRLVAAGVKGYNMPRLTPNHPKKKGIVVAKEGDRIKTIRFGAQGYKHNYSKEGRKKFKTRHRSNIARGKMSAAYWADKVLWSGPKGHKQTKETSRKSNH